MKDIIKEQATYSSFIDYKKEIKSLLLFMVNQGLNIHPLPKLILKHGDINNAKIFFSRTAYYDPQNYSIVLYTEGRHPKDIVRSFAHEMIHHIQNLEGKLQNLNTYNTNEDSNLNQLEKEAYLNGNIIFRNWEDQTKSKNF
jgi:hypothetical protein